MFNYRSFLFLLCIKILKLSCCNSTFQLDKKMIRVARKAEEGELPKEGVDGWKQNSCEYSSRVSGIMHLILGQEL